MGYRVSDLIDKDSHWWNVSLVDEVFEESSLTIEIKKVPLNNLAGPVAQINSCGREHRMGYFRLSQLIHGISQGLGECYTRSEPQSLWRKVWKLKVPNKVKHFIWRACYTMLFQLSLICQDVRFWGMQNAPSARRPANQ
jgi:hypothetical protein